MGTHMNALAEKHGLAVAYPARVGSRRMSASCWNWFKPGNRIRGAGEPAILASLARKLMKDFGLDRGSVFVAGLSAGGGHGGNSRRRLSDVFSAAGVHSGLARGAAHDLHSAIMALRSGGANRAMAVNDPGLPHLVRRIVFQGAADSTVHPSNAAMIVAAAVGRDATPVRTSTRSVHGTAATPAVTLRDPTAAFCFELWMLEGAGHAWSGGRPAGSYTDSTGPDASAQMVRFFLTQSA